MRAHLSHEHKQPRGIGRGKMRLLDKLRKQRFKSQAKKKIRQGFKALLWLHQRQLSLGWTSKERKQFWHDFVRSPASRARTIVKGMEMVAPGTKTKEK